MLKNTQAHSRSPKPPISASHHQTNTILCYIQTWSSSKPLLKIYKKKNQTKEEEILSLSLVVCVSSFQNLFFLNSLTWKPKPPQNLPPFLEKWFKERSQTILVSKHNMLNLTNFPQTWNYLLHLLINKTKMIKVNFLRKWRYQTQSNSLILRLFNFNQHQFQQKQQQQKMVHQITWSTQVVHNQKRNFFM